jgi:glucose-1-phosphate cytidylyltransferase
MFLANYTDGLTNLPLPKQLDHFRTHDSIASFISVKPQISYHVVTSDSTGKVTAIDDISRTKIRINGGYFILKREIFDYLKEGEELVREPFHRLLKDGRLTAFEYDDFWMAMDTFKDRQQLEEIYGSGNAPWEVWSSAKVANPAPTGVPV